MTTRSARCGGSWRARPPGSTRCSARPGPRRQSADEAVDALLGVAGSRRGGVGHSQRPAGGRPALPGHVGDRRRPRHGLADPDQRPTGQTITVVIGGTLRLRRPRPDGAPRRPATRCRPGRRSRSTAVAEELVDRAGHRDRRARRRPRPVPTVRGPDRPEAGDHGARDDRRRRGSRARATGSADPERCCPSASSSSTWAFRPRCPPTPILCPRPAVTICVTIDGAPVPVRVDGTVGEAARRSAAGRGRLCDPSRYPPGRSLLETDAGASSGFDLDQVVLASAAGGGPGRDTLVRGPEPVDPAARHPCHQPVTARWERRGRRCRRALLGGAGPVASAPASGHGRRRHRPRRTDADQRLRQRLAGRPRRGRRGHHDHRRMDPPAHWSGSPWSSRRSGFCSASALLVWPLRRGRVRLARYGALDAHPVRGATRIRGAALSVPRAAAAALGMGLLTWILAGWAVALGVALVSIAALRVARGASR